MATKVEMTDLEVLATIQQVTDHIGGWLIESSPTAMEQQDLVRLLREIDDLPDGDREPLLDRRETARRFTRYDIPTGQRAIGILNIVRDYCPNGNRLDVFRQAIELIAAYRPTHNGENHRTPIQLL